jgi:hypothetical protein
MSSGEPFPEILLEAGQETRPPLVRLDPQPVELVSQRREALEKLPLDLGFELAQALFGSTHQTHHYPGGRLAESRQVLVIA